MSGHVFHPGHAELHGITVVVETTGEMVYVGRYHEETPRGVLLHDVAEHRPSTDGPSREQFVSKTLKFGVRPQHKSLVVPSAEVRRISRLVEWG
ncbi:MAG TPA: hypothetical protein VMG41_10325 [Gemmatimonadales bacterium]|nr:hypothetical protein [Gemmatimonadales bacterium]